MPELEMIADWLRLVLVPGLGGLLAAALFALLRTSPDGAEQIVAIHNVSGQTARADLSAVPLDGITGYTDLITGTPVAESTAFDVKPYQVLWLKAHPVTS